MGPLHRRLDASGRRGAVSIAAWALAAAFVAFACSSDEDPASSGASNTGGNDGGASGSSAADGGAAGKAGAAGSAAVGGAGAAGSAGGAGQAGTGAAGEAGAPGETGPSCPLGGACSGYTLIGSPENNAGPDFTAMLIDMEGNIVHRWNITGFPPKMLPGGSLIGCRGVYPSSSYDCIEMRQETWDGTLEWSFSDWDFTIDPPAARHHHDMQREGNPLGYYAPGQDFVAQGKTLVLAHSRKTVPAIRDGQLDDDVIYEVDFAGALTGFEWHGTDHFEEFGLDDAAKEDISTRPGAVLEWLHGNSISLLGPNRWFDEGHVEFHPDNIMYSSRSANFVIIISRETGAVVWRIGPDFAGRPEAGLGQVVGQHMPHLIPVGLPGAGNVLLFDNGGSAGYGGPSSNPSGNRHQRGYSRVIEFDPIDFELVWEAGSASGADSIYSPLLSNAQRLPNGNTLITLGVPGRVLEVTPENQLVWEYQYDAPGGGDDDWVYRAYRVPPEWLPAGVNGAHGNYASWRGQFE